MTDSNEDVQNEQKERPDNLLRYFVKQYYQVQKRRIAVSNINDSILDKGKFSPEMKEIQEDLEQTESKMSRYMKKEVKNYDLWQEYLKDIRGIGHTLASALIVEIDIEKAKHPSSLWRYAGLHVICPDCTNTVEKEYEMKDGSVETREVEVPVCVESDGKCAQCGADGIGARRIKGVQSDWNTFLKDTCFLIGDSFVKQKGDAKEIGKGKYRKVYDESRAYYDEKYPEPEVVNGSKKYTDGHKHAMARRRTVKHFLADLHSVWREMEGLSNSDVYPHRND